MRFFVDSGKKLYLETWVLINSLINLIEDFSKCLTFYVSEIHNIQQTLDSLISFNRIRILYFPSSVLRIFNVSSGSKSLLSCECNFASNSIQLVSYLGSLSKLAFGFPSNNLPASTTSMRQIDNKQAVKQWFIIAITIGPLYDWTFLTCLQALLEREM